MAFPLLFYCLGLSCAHVICLHQIHPHFPQCLPYLHVYFPLLILCTLFIYFFNLLGSVSASNMYISGESPIAAWTVYMRVPHL